MKVEREIMKTCGFTWKLMQFW